MSKRKKNKKPFSLKSFLDKSFKGKTKWFWAVIFTSIIVDYLNSYFYDDTQNFFYKIFEGRDTRTIMYLLIIYVLFIAVVIFSGFMSSYPKERYVKKRKITEIFMMLIISGFGIILMFPSVDILGISSDTSNFSDSAQYTYLMIFIGLILVLIPFSVVNFKSRLFLGDFNYFIYYIPLIILVSLFIDFSAAIWKFSLFDPEHIADPNRKSRIIEFIAMFPLYAVFFSAPRFVLLRKSYNILSFLSAIAMTAYFVWKSLEFIEL